MACIALLLDSYLGHLYPAYGFAKSLAVGGHEVHFLGIQDLATSTKEQGFPFHAVFEEAYPKGYLAEFKKMQEENSADFQLGKVPRQHLPAILEGSLKEIMDQIRPDLFIAIHSLPLELFLIQHCFPNTKYAIFTSWLRPAQSSPLFLASHHFRSLEQAIKTKLMTLMGERSVATFSRRLKMQLGTINELIACPAELDFPTVRYANKVYHIDAAIRASKTNTGFMEALNIPEDKKIIYASLGSQTALFMDRAKHFFAVLIELMKSEAAANYFMILTIGREMDGQLFPSIPGKLAVRQWTPQLEVLQKADLVISHGGLGTIKECIVNQVPMIISPMIYDQLDNAQRVLFHGLGLVVDPGNADVEEMKRAILHVFSDESIAGHLARMCAIFTEKNTQNTTLQVVDTLLEMAPQEQHSP